MFLGRDGADIALSPIKYQAGIHTSLVLAVGQCGCREGCGVWDGVFVQVHAGWSGLDHRMNEYGNTGEHNKTERADPVSRGSSRHRQELRFLCVFPCLHPSLFFSLKGGERDLGGAEEQIVSLLSERGWMET